MDKHPLYNTTGLQKNNKSHVMYALANKQMELKQLEDEYEAKITKVKSDLTAMEQVMFLFDKDCGSTIKKLNKSSSKASSSNQDTSKTFRLLKGEGKKYSLQILREAKEPLKTDVISLKIQQIKQFPTDDKEINSKFQKSIVEQLRRLEKNGLVERVGRDGIGLLWKIKSF